VSEPGDLERSFAAMERLRARVLLERLARDERAGPPPALAEVQSALAPDEAMIAFQLWAPHGGPELPYSDGSSWAIAVARTQARALRVPDAPALERSVRVLAALIERRDGSEAAGAARLYHELFAGALEQLPAAVRKLVIVPDGPLHRLPFEALRPSLEAPPLAAGWEISVAPSAALWLRWRRSPRAPSAAPLLALADPVPGPAAAPLGLRPLPYGRLEAESAVRALGRGSRLEVGESASEQLLKRTDLRAFGALHLAAHGVLDEDRPERSAVVLSPGGGEDGLLTVREASALDLCGRLVVLAACHSSSGAVLRGEGALSLARAFFQAGAHSVIGSLWTLRDDEAAALFAEFYRRLGEGRTVGQAMALARRERIAQGAPTAAWAGLSLLGDGALAPVAPPPSWRWALIAAAALVAYALIRTGWLAAFPRLRRAGSPAPLAAGRGPRP
jgi:CHAT domain-containing protein